MRCFTRVQDSPDHPDNMKPQSVHRFEVSEDQIITERYDRKSRSCVDNPGMIAFTGIGGADDYVEINEAKALELIDEWHGIEASRGP
ncbi:MAG: hypothetical protein ACC700_15630 [Anaerolineales bacterium]